ncbi:hypothetical protein [Aphanothece sacrum]|uniref:Uncharacterized protein n=1 Tax=Aphanothece sacrum FPU1 TaxID=1920663 RepID=A0A401IMW0_APHSA|nr:hypothetical protein [Aphanothece sacrum]GBF82576.1 hypothetical protein AsFPU1_4006 [Aphanothece sacrum FPU1]GBF84710.1 hypothetical protein AsFPU3_1764 [Aphanothece sacrum FPU3]
MSYSFVLVNPLNYHSSYTCPVCRHGEISTLPLMEAFACNFCHHIFTANLEKQSLTLVDSQLPLTWYWTGKSWQGMRSSSQLKWFYQVGGIAFVVLPTSLVSLGVYVFPPLTDSPLSWFPVFWIGLTFLSHLSCIVWLIIEYYQLPISLYFEAIRQNLFSRLNVT